MGRSIFVDSLLTTQVIAITTVITMATTNPLLPALTQLTTEVAPKTRKARFLGICDDQTVCDCCGKSNLKRTVALDFEGDVRRYGVNCAARALGLSGKYTARDAGRLESDLAVKQERAERFAKAKEQAHRLAASCGEPVYVIRAEHNWSYLTVREAAFNARSYLYNSPSYVAEVA